MPRFKTLSKAEVEKLIKRRGRGQDLTAYLSFLDTLKPGDWASATLEEGETPRAVKRRLNAASKQKGMQLKYRKSDDGRIIFEVK